MKIAFFLLIFCYNANASRILGLFPHPGISHFYYFRSVMEALAEAGHEVTVVSQFPTKNPVKNYKDEPLSGKPNLTNTVNIEVNLKSF
jgi:glucuronosyltransferase